MQIGNSMLFDVFDMLFDVSDMLFVLCICKNLIFRLFDDILQGKNEG